MSLAYCNDLVVQVMISYTDLKLTETKVEGSVYFVAEERNLN